MRESRSVPKTVACRDMRSSSSAGMPRSTADAPSPVWPQGVTRLAAHVTAPDELAARLALCVVARQSEAPRLAKILPTGARLVTVEGDLYRWDGFVSRAEAPRPAAVRLAQRTRLAELEAEIDTGKPALEAAQIAQRVAQIVVRIRDVAVQPDRAPDQVDAALAKYRADNKITGICDSARIARQSATPSIPGSITSSKASTGSDSRHATRPASPSSAAITSKPLRVR